MTKFGGSDVVIIAWPMKTDNTGKGGCAGVRKDEAGVSSRSGSLSGGGGRTVTNGYGSGE